MATKTYNYSRYRSYIGGQNYATSALSGSRGRMGRMVGDSSLRLSSAGSRAGYWGNRLRIHSGTRMAGFTPRSIGSKSVGVTGQRVRTAAVAVNRGVSRYGFQAAVGISAGTAAFAGYKAIQRRRGRRRSVAHRYSNRPLSSSQRSAIARRTASKRRRVRGRFA